MCISYTFWDTVLRKNSEVAIGDLVPGLRSFVVNHFCCQTSKSLPSLCLARYYNVLIGKRVNVTIWQKERVSNVSLGVVEVHVTYTKCPPLDISVIIIIYLNFCFGDQKFFMATILQLKVANRRLFEKVSLEHCEKYFVGRSPHILLLSMFHVFLGSNNCRLLTREKGLEPFFCAINPRKFSPT